LISAFAVYSSLDEWETKAYEDIRKLYDNEESTYINNFIKMKIQKISFNKINLFRKYQISRSNYRYLIMKRYNLSISVFYEKLFEIIDKTHNTLSSFSNRLYKINPAIINLHIKSINLLDIFKMSRDNTYRLLNLINIMRYLKYTIPLESIIHLIKIMKKYVNI
jgi:hypothetical protein